MVEFFEDGCFIYSNELVCDIPENPGADTSHIFATLNRQELILGFCNYESGGSYGYVFIERGGRTQSSQETVKNPGRDAIQEYAVFPTSLKRVGSLHRDILKRTSRSQKTVAESTTCRPSISRWRSFVVFAHALRGVGEEFQLVAKVLSLRRRYLPASHANMRAPFT